MTQAVIILLLVLAALVPFCAVFAVRRSWLPWALAGLGIVSFTAYAIYVLQFYECPSGDGECDPGLGVFYLGILLVLWLGGIAAGSAGAWMRGRVSASAPRRSRPE